MRCGLIGAQYLIFDFVSFCGLFHLVLHLFVLVHYVAQEVLPCEIVMIISSTHIASEARNLSWLLLIPFLDDDRLGVEEHYFVSFISFFVHVANFRSSSIPSVHSLNLRCVVSEKLKGSRYISSMCFLYT